MNEHVLQPNGLIERDFPKNCKICGIELTVDNANIHKKRGCFVSRCKKCISKTRKDARLRDLEHFKHRETMMWFIHGKERSIKNRERYKKDPEYSEMHRRASRSYHWKNRDVILSRIARRRREIWYEALDFFGGGCACCGEDTIEFLSVDHIGGNGGYLRKEKGERVGNELLRSFKANGWNPSIRKNYRLLCYNCNSSLGKYGYCPHQMRQYTRYQIPGGDFYNFSSCSLTR